MNQVAMPHAPTHTLRLNNIPVSINLYYEKMRRNRTTRFKFTRRIAQKFQARFYVVNPENGHSEWINLGMHESEERAAAVVRDFIKTGQRPRELLPKYVRRCASGKFIGIVRLRKWNPEVIQTKPMSDPDKCYQEIRRLILARFGKSEFARFFPFG